MKKSFITSGPDLVCKLILYTSTKHVPRDITDYCPLLLSYCTVPFRLYVSYTPKHRLVLVDIIHKHKACTKRHNLPLSSYTVLLYCTLLSVCKLYTKAQASAS